MTITLFPLDKDVTGRIRCTLGNWAGVVYKIPRTKRKLCNEDIGDISKHLSRCGIYFLFGEDPESGRKSVYVGQAVSRANGNGVLGRVMEHDDIEWTEAVILVHASEKSILEAGLKYLENRFYRLAMAAGRYKVLNGNTPNPGNPTEELKSDLDDFVEYARTALIVLGHEVLEPLATASSKRDEDSPLLYMECNGHKAQGMLTNDGFVILKGSMINPSPKKSCPPVVLRVREECADKIQGNKLVSDILLGSPSSAAGFVSGASNNGRICWHDSKGRTLEQLEELQGKAPHQAAIKTQRENNYEEDEEGDAEADDVGMDDSEVDNTNCKNGLLLFMNGNGYEAKGMLTDEGFVVLKGSSISPITHKSCSEPIRRVRESEKIKGNQLISDITFGSSSSAAGFVSGSSSNGRICWHDSEGRTLKQLEEN